MSTELSQYRSFAADIAYRAGRFTLGYFGCGVKAEKKADHTPVTEADRGAEKMIREAISKAFPTHGILGEEFGETNAGAAIRWVLDPIDGTKAFVRGLPTYSVLIGVEIDNKPRAGAAYLPAMDEMVTAAEGLGATVNGRPCKTSGITSLADSLMVTGDVKSIYRLGKGATYERLREACGETKTLPDAYGHLLVATGRAEIMLDPAVNRWDVAALWPILLESRGRLTTWSGLAEYFRPEALSVSNDLYEAVFGLISR